MEKEFVFKRVDRLEVTSELFNQIMEVESCEGDGYDENQMRALFIEDEKDDNFVCFHKDRAIAYMSLNPQSKRRNGSVYIISIMVLPEYRRRGIAQGLIKVACDYYIQKGIEMPMSLQVDKDNVPAINLYKKVGFEIKEPICPADEDEEQYIMAVNLFALRDNVNKITIR